jgi:hypothetical protein
VIFHSYVNVYQMENFIKITSATEDDPRICWMICTDWRPIEVGKNPILVISETLDLCKICEL